MDDIIAQYYEDLLRAQYQVSEKLVRDQHLSCGTIREEFLREILIRKRNSIKITKGFVKKGNIKSGECDQIFHHQDSPVDVIGGQLFIEPKYCKLVLEIKSNATGDDLKKTNENFEKVKLIDPENKPRCGLFCYNTILGNNTIFKRFGLLKDNDIGSWEDDAGLKLVYPYIDFVVCVACMAGEEECIEKQFFLIKDENSGRYILRPEYPIIGNFFGVTDNL